MTGALIAKVVKPVEWGWTSYKWTRWVGADGRRIYEGNLQEIGDNFGYTSVRVQFSATSPTKALRAAVSEPRTTQQVIDFLTEWKD